MQRRVLVSAIFACALFLAPSAVSAAQVSVNMGPNYFTPANLTIQAGDTVVWRNTDTMAHTVTARGGAFSSGTMQSGATFTRTFTTPGTYTYDCIFHGGMTGTVTVQAASVSQTSTQTAVTAAQIQTQIQTLLAEVQKLQAELAQGGTTAPTASAPTSTTGANCPLVGRVLRRGSTGDDVSRLQRFLAGDPTVYPEAQITGYYGALTEAAVKRWQAKYNIVSSGDPDSTGFGVVGPRTAAAIALQCGQGGGTGSSNGPAVGGFIQVTPVTGNAPLTVQVMATVNTVASCQGATYTLDWGDGTVAQSIAVAAGNCGQLQQTYSHTYIYGGVYTLRLSAGQHSTTATVQVSGPARPN